MDEKSSGHFGGPSRGRRFSRQLMPKIDKPSERELMEKKERRGGKKGRNPRRKNALAAERKYTRGRCVHPGRSKTRVRAHCCAASALSAAKRGQLKRDRNFGGRKLGKFFARVVEKKKRKFIETVLREHQINPF